MKNSIAIRMFAALTVAGLSSSALADPVLMDGLYRLYNHRDGSAQAPLYGLRLDGLGSGNENDIYTFDFDHQDTAMFLELNVADGTIHIFGSAYGGLDIGGEYDDPTNGHVGFWDIDFTYRDELLVHGDGQITVGPMNPQENNGTITPRFTSPIFDGSAIPLIDYNSPREALRPTFHLDFGHRSPSDVISGWGWLNHSGGDHLYDSDWLFEVDPQPVPVPGAVLLGALGLGMVRWVGRRFG